MKHRLNLQHLNLVPQLILRRARARTTPVMAEDGRLRPTWTITGARSPSNIPQGEMKEQNVHEEDNWRAWGLLETRS